MTNSDFFAARDIQEACTRLSQSGTEAHILAGGTDLMVAINRRRLFPQELIYIGESGMDGIEITGEHLVIGAAASHTAIVESQVIKENAGRSDQRQFEISLPSAAISAMHLRPRMLPRLSWL